MRTTAPAEYRKLTAVYAALLDVAVTYRTYQVGTRLSPRLQLLANDLGRLNAHPRDLVEIHRAAFARMHQGLALGKSQLLLEESRMVLLEAMGYLAAYYRARTEAVI